MPTNILEARGGCIIPKPEDRGYFIPYRPGERNACPGCGKAHWWVGRLTAECAFCHTALELTTQRSGGGVYVSRGRRA